MVSNTASLTGPRQVLAVLEPDHAVDQALRLAGASAGMPPRAAGFRLVNYSAFTPMPALSSLRLVSDQRTGIPALANDIGDAPPMACHGADEGAKALGTLTRFTCLRETTAILAPRVGPKNVTLRVD